MKRNKKIYKKLTDNDVGKEFQVYEIKATDIEKESLKNIGVYPGIKILIKRKSPIKGPVIIEISGVDIALGYNLAERIFGKSI